MIIGISGVAGAGKDTCADFLVRKHGFMKVALADALKRAAREIYDFSVEQLWGPSAMRNAPDLRYPREHTWVASDADEFTVAYPSCACCGVSAHGASAHSEPPQCYLTPRYALQHLGTEHGRHCYATIWIERCLAVARKLSVEGGFHYTAVRGLEATWRPGDDNWFYDVAVPDIRFENEIAAFRDAEAKLIRVVRPDAGLGAAGGSHVSETEQARIPNSAFDAAIINDGTLAELESKVTLFHQGVQP